MVVQEKMDQALELYHERQRIKTEEYRRRYGETPTEVERGDVPAMILAAFLMILPAVLLLLLLMVGAGYFFLLH